MAMGPPIYQPGSEPPQELQEQVEDVDSGWRTENGWGILINSPPNIGEEGWDPGDIVPSEVYALIPNMQNGNLAGYILAKLVASDGAMGHVWEGVTPPAGLNSNARLGVELVLHPKYEYPETFTIVPKD